MLRTHPVVGGIALRRVLIGLVQDSGNLVKFPSVRPWMGGIRARSLLAEWMQKKPQKGHDENEYEQHHTGARWRILQLLRTRTSRQ